jgi:hypothetical protein
MESHVRYSYISLFVIGPIWFWLKLSVVFVICNDCRTKNTVYYQWSLKDNQII